jgi:hypothetical protein
MSRTGVGATSQKKVNQPSAKYAEGVVCCLIVEVFDTDDANESNTARLDRYRDGIDNNNDNQPMYVFNREGTNKGAENVRLYPSPKRRPTKVLTYFADNKPHMGA